MNKLILDLLRQEREFIAKNIFSNSKEFAQNETSLRVIEQESILSIHNIFLKSLIHLYINSKFANKTTELKEIFDIKETYVIEYASDNINFIPALIEELHITFLNSEFKFVEGALIKTKSKNYVKKLGAVYTQKEIAKDIIKNCFKRAISDDNNINKIKCLDFGSGTGRFYFEALQMLHKEYKLDYEEIVCDVLYAVDIDVIAINILKCKALSYFSIPTPKIISSLLNNIVHRNALMPLIKLINEEENSIDLIKDFRGIINNGGFDVVFSNPPYSLLKINKKEHEKRNNCSYEIQKNTLQTEISFFKKSGFYKYSIEGMLNYYQISIEMIINLTKLNGIIGIICPSSLFADLTSSKLRKYILNTNRLKEIYYYPESSMLFENITQATSIFYMQKGGKTNTIKLETPGNTFKIDLSIIHKTFNERQEIPFLDETGWKILQKISKHKKLKHLSFLENKRGELDLTHYKNCISEVNTGWRLVRGNMISNKEIIDRNNEYVKIDKFLNLKSENYKCNYFNKKRLICQQISNMESKKRLKFVFCGEKDILGNSCNFIFSTRNELDLLKLKYILNTRLINWRFKITSSNNHINNYELDELPVINLEDLNLNMFSDDEVENEIIICNLYGLNETETEYILKTLNFDLETVELFEQKTI